MGCDIHTICEVKEDGKWKVNPLPVFKAGYHWEKPKKRTNPPDDRDYGWFAVLADVRNDRKERLDCIDKPKGIADDATKEWVKMANDMEGDMHSHSYFTLDELLAFDWDGKVISCSAFVTPAEKVMLNGANKRTKEWRGLQADAFKVHHIWTETYRQWLDGKVDKWIKPMQKLRETYEDVRICFGFDN